MGPKNGIELNLAHLQKHAMTALFGSQACTKEQAKIWDPKNGIELDLSKFVMTALLGNERGSAQTEAAPKASNTKNGESRLKNMALSDLKGVVG